MASFISQADSDYEYFAPMALKRSNSHHKLGTSPSDYTSSTPTLHSPYRSPSKTYSDSAPSSAPSSPLTAQAESSDLSYVSTPSTNFSIACDYEDTLAIAESPEDDFAYPSFSQDKFFIHSTFQPDDNLEPPPSPRTGDSYTVSPTDHEGSDNVSRPSTPECAEHAEDDTAVATRPSRQVDYLSHDWTEEDLWMSWSYIVARKTEFGNSARLENASWRTWAKVKNNLSTISPETLNWLKDCDVTWLYGPLQSSPSRLHSTRTEPPSASLSKTDSFSNLTKKPILKKRSMSEVMLRRSLSSASLLKQATAAVQAQETKGISRPSLARSHTDYVTFPFSTRRLSQDPMTSLEPSTNTSGLTSPWCERKHIHFNEQVEQCIAVDVKGDDEEDLDNDRFREDSDSDGGVMMKRMQSKKKAPRRKKRVKKTMQADGKTIAMLPSTKLKYRDDASDMQETAMKHSTVTLRSPLISPSSSQETLRPAKPSSRFYIHDDEDVDDGFFASDPDCQESSSGGPHRSGSSSDLSEEPAGMRRTASGMLMPYDEGDSSSGDGIFGRVIDTVNTARDIAHVIWNVGWRK